MAARRNGRILLKERMRPFLYLVVAFFRRRPVRSIRRLALGVRIEVVNRNGQAVVRDARFVCGFACLRVIGLVLVGIVHNLF